GAGGGRVGGAVGGLAGGDAGRLGRGAAGAGVAGAVEDLLTRGGQGPGGAPAGPAAKRERRVAARTRAAGPSVPSVPGPGDEPSAGEAGNGEGDGDAIVPMPIFDPFREAEKWR